MSVAGLCQICEAAMAEHSCRQCGRAVCDDHWNDGSGACMGCTQGPVQ